MEGSSGRTLNYDMELLTSDSSTEMNTILLHIMHTFVASGKALPQLFIK